jgi:hypothetical protein
MKTHPIIDRTIEKLKKVQHPGQTMLGNFRHLSYKDKKAFETTRIAGKNFCGKRRSS